MMGEIARGRSLVQASAGAASEVKVLSEQLREAARYRGAEDTVPVAESLDAVAGPAGAARMNVLREDLWGITSLLL